MPINRNQIIAVLLFAVLLWVSFYKDLYSPDYRNTLSAAFLAPGAHEGSRLHTFFTHSTFWIKSILYSFLFIVLPAAVIHFAFLNKWLTRYTAAMMGFLFVLIYGLVLIDHPTLDVVIVSKVNRYFHAPVLTMFLWAAFTLTRRKDA